MNQGSPKLGRESMGRYVKRLERELGRLRKQPLRKLSGKKILGQHWLEVAAERMLAGEPEERVMADYGYVRGEIDESRGPA